jgi:hypothetical protein
MSMQEWSQLLRRVQIVVGHHRYRGLAVDARAVVQRVLASYPARPPRLLQYRALLEEAVDSLVRGFR